MYKTACPACGASVEFKSAGSVMAVCAYCRSTLLREADAVRNIGRMSEVIEDHTRIQIGTSGQYQGRNFGVVGRIQLRYEDGFWNEWYVVFDDGKTGWLSDGSGQYVFTEAIEVPAQLPSFEQIRPGATIQHNGTRFTATDVRAAQCVAGQGELPFQVGEGWTARVADFRAEERFLTLDYSDGAAPQVYAGLATTLEALKCQFLREAEQVEETAGKLQGKTGTLECPNCGSGITYAAGQAEHLVCPACHAEVSASADKVEVLKKHDELQQVRTTLELGATATIDKVKWRLIGLMRCREYGSDETSTWTEYLLFNAKSGFMWLVETDEGWTRTEVLNLLPTPTGGSVRYAGKGYTKKWAYGSEVIYAAGAFNWRVSIGDKTWITDYYGPDGTLSEEKTDQEITWSLGRDISGQQVMQWFGLTATPAAGQTQRLSRSTLKASPLGGFAKFASWGLLILNVPQILSGGVLTLLFTGVALLMLWIPVWTTASGGDEESA